MLKKTITYTNFNGDLITEDLYFHYNVPEITRLHASVGGDLDIYVKELQEREDLSEMIAFVEMMILDAYGVKSEDGRSFQKTPAIRLDFENSIAYAELFTELMTDTEAIAEFAAGLINTPGQSTLKQQAKVDSPVVSINKSSNDVLSKAAETPKNELSMEQLLSLVKNNPELLSKISENK